MEEKTETKMFPLSIEISEPFYNFLKEHLAFFGSDMTIEDLCQQMVYEESRRLHHALTEFVEGNNYVGRRPWLEKHKDVALTYMDLIDSEDEDSATEKTQKAESMSVTP